jgi:glycosyltransferase involved in cell wall biosynthesis
MRKNILHILSGDIYGGAEAQLSHQLPALKREGWNVKALLFNSGETEKKLSEKEITTFICRESEGTRLLFQNALAETIRFSPNIIISHGYKETFLAAYLSFKLNIPFIVTFHGKAEVTKSIKYKLYLFIQDILARYFARKIICVSNTLEKDLNFFGHSASIVIYNVFALVEGQEIVSENSSSEVCRLGCIGRLAEVKNLTLAIDALKELSLIAPQKLFSLSLIGEGPERENLESYARRLGLASKVHFLGYQEDIAGALNGIDIFIMTSLYEGLPTALLEAINMGVPVVTTAVGGINEVKTLLPQYPLRLTTFNANQFAQTILKATSDPRGVDVKNELKKHFSPESQAKTISSLYSSIINTGL